MRPIIFCFFLLVVILGKQQIHVKENVPIDGRSSVSTDYSAFERESQQINKINVNNVHDQNLLKQKALLGPPRMLQIIAGDKQNMLSWDIPASGNYVNLLYYQIFVSQAYEGTFNLFHKVDVPLPMRYFPFSYIHTGLTNGQTYYYRVFTESSEGRSVQFAEGSATPSTASSMPINLQAVYNDATIILSWDEPSVLGSPTLQEYIIERKTVTADFVELNRTNARSYTDSHELAPGITYSYHVATTNGFMVSEWSSSFQLKTPGISGEAKNLQVFRGDNFISLSWESPTEYVEPIIGYVLFKYEGTCLCGSPKQATTTVQSFNDTSAANTQIYTYAVSTVFASGKQSNPINITVLLNEVNSEAVVLNAKISRMNNIVYLSWEIPTTFPVPIKYEIQRSPNLQGPYTVVKTTTNRYYTDTTLIIDNAYYYRIYVVSAEGKNSKFVSLSTIFTITLKTPTNFFGEYINGSVILTWDEINAEVPNIEYEISRAVTTDQYSIIKTTALTSYKDTQVTNGVSYFYKIRAISRTSASIATFFVITTTEDKLVSGNQTTNEDRFLFGIFEGQDVLQLVGSSIAIGSVILAIPVLYITQVRKKKF